MSARYLSLHGSVPFQRYTEQIYVCLFGLKSASKPFDADDKSCAGKILMGGPTVAVHVHRAGAPQGLRTELIPNVTC